MSVYITKHAFTKSHSDVCLVSFHVVLFTQGLQKQVVFIGWDCYVLSYVGLIWLELTAFWPFILVSIARATFRDLQHSLCLHQVSHAPMSRPRRGQLGACPEGFDGAGAFIRNPLPCSRLQQLRVLQSARSCNRNNLSVWSTDTGLPRFMCWLPLLFVQVGEADKLCEPSLRPADLAA